MNERIRAINGDFGVVDGTTVVMCECGQADCFQQIPVPVGVQGEVWAHDGRFLVSPGHEGLEDEHVVARAATYSIVAAAFRDSDQAA